MNKELEIIIKDVCSVDKQPHGVVVTDEQGMIVYLSSKSCQVLGSSEKDFLGKNLIDVIHDEDMGISVDNTILDSGGLFRREEKYLMLDKYQKSKQPYLAFEISDVTEIVMEGFVDSLTGLYNRGFFDAELKRLRNSRLYPITLLFSDMNGFKKINDTYGHRAGDECLKKAAEILKNNSRSDDIVARYGGDEFAILLPSISEHAADVVVKRIEESFDLYNKQNPRIPLQISVGFFLSLIHI